MTARRRSPEDATLLDALIDGFERNEVLAGFHCRELPLPDEEAAVRTFASLGTIGSPLTKPAGPEASPLVPAGVTGTTPRQRQARRREQPRPKSSAARRAGRWRPPCSRRRSRGWKRACSSAPRARSYNGGP